MTLPRPTGGERAAPGEERVVDEAPRRDHLRDGAGLEVVEHDEVGAPARRDEPPVAQPEDARGRNARGAVGRKRRRAEPDRGADEEVEMALLGDVERIAVVGAEGDEGRVALGDRGASACRSLQTEPSRISTAMPFDKFLVALGEVRHLVVGADAGAEIAVEGEAAEQRAVAVDRPGLEGGELGEACRDRARAGPG